MGNILNKMPSIPQFKDVIKEVRRISDFSHLDENDEPVYNKCYEYPIVNVVGTVKLHGTFAGVSLYKGELYPESKERRITIEDDNAGFAKFVEERKDILENLLSDIILFHGIGSKNIVTLMGEWAGKGIVKGTAISKKEKSFYIFGVKVKPPIGESFWVDNHVYLYSEVMKSYNDYNIYDINQFKKYYIKIDFNDPDLVYNKMKDMVLEVEKECPVGKYFNISGIGEGIVFCFKHKNRTFMFKMKGEKHAGKCKIKKMKIVDDEKNKKIKEVIIHILPEWRLEQMYQETFDTINGGEGDIKQTGDFIRSILKDIRKEEQEYLDSKNISSKEINSKIADVSRRWFMEKLN